MPPLTSEAELGAIMISQGLLSPIELKALHEHISPDGTLPLLGDAMLDQELIEQDRLNLVVAQLLRSKTLEALHFFGERLIQQKLIDAPCLTNALDYFAKLPPHPLPAPVLFLDQLRDAGAISQQIHTALNAKLTPLVTEFRGATAYGHDLDTTLDESTKFLRMAHQHGLLSATQLLKLHLLSHAPARSGQPIQHIAVSVRVLSGAQVDALMKAIAAGIPGLAGAGPAVSAAAPHAAAATAQAQTTLDDLSMIESESELIAIAEAELSEEAKSALTPDVVPEAALAVEAPPIDATPAIEAIPAALATPAIEAVEVAPAVEAAPAPLATPAIEAVEVAPAVEIATAVPTLAQSDDDELITAEEPALASPTLPPGVEMLNFDGEPGAGAGAQGLGFSFSGKGSGPAAPQESKPSYGLGASLSTEQDAFDSLPEEDEDDAPEPRSATQVSPTRRQSTRRRMGSSSELRAPASSRRRRQSGSHPASGGGVPPAALAGVGLLVIAILATLVVMFGGGPSDDPVKSTGGEPTGSSGGQTPGSGPGSPVDPAAKMADTLATGQAAIQAALGKQDLVGAVNALRELRQSLAAYPETEWSDALYQIELTVNQNVLDKVNAEFTRFGELLEQKQVDECAKILEYVKKIAPDEMSEMVSTMTSRLRKARGN